MGAFLAALGAVLLFVLKAVGILLLAVLVLVVLLLLCPFCADLCWEHGVLTVKAGALGITFPVFQYPKPEPPPTSAQARSSATIFPALPLFFFCSGTGADGCGCAAKGCCCASNGCSKLYG